MDAPVAAGVLGVSRRAQQDEPRPAEVAEAARMAAWIWFFGVFIEKRDVQRDHMRRHDASSAHWTHSRPKRMANIERTIGSTAWSISPG